MKTVIKKLLALLLIASTLFALTSCSLFAPRPPRNIEKAKQNLEDAGYSVYYVDDTSYLAPNSLAGSDYINQWQHETNLLYRDVDKYLSSMNITIIVFKSSKAAKIYYEQLKICDTNAEKAENEIDQMKFLLKHYSDDLSAEEIAYYEKEISVRKEQIKEHKKNYIIARSGKMVWYGTKDAIKATR